MNKDWYRKKANQIANSYHLKTKVKFKKDIDFMMGTYNTKKDIIYLNPELMKDQLEFFKTLLHEINHAMYCRDMGADAYTSDYELEIERCIISNLDPYNDNFYEIKAEEFAEDNYEYCSAFWGYK
jgi:Zn-dependent peptidase ImmA (M78 family)